MLHGAFRTAGERATCRNVGHGDISGIRKVRDTLRSTSNWRSVWGCVFYLFIIPVTLKHADISYTWRNECKIRSVTHSACGDVETTCRYTKGKSITQIMLFPVVLKGSRKDRYIEQHNCIAVIRVSSHIHARVNIQQPRLFWAVDRASFSKLWASIW
jgi:hypothetical protein